MVINSINITDNELESILKSEELQLLSANDLFNQGIDVTANLINVTPYEPGTEQFLKVGWTAYHALFSSDKTKGQYIAAGRAFDIAHYYKLGQEAIDNANTVEFKLSLQQNPFNALACAKGYKNLTDENIKEAQLAIFEHYKTSDADILNNSECANITIIKYNLGEKAVESLKSERNERFRLPWKN